MEVPQLPEIVPVDPETIVDVKLDWSTISGSKLETEQVSCTFEGGTEEIDGPDGKALVFSGSKFAKITSKVADACLLNLDQCGNGITVMMRVKIDVLAEDTYFFSSGAEVAGNGGMACLYKFGKVRCIAATQTKVWYVEMKQKIELKTWLKFQLSFHVERGLAIYINDKEISRTYKYV